MDLFGDIGARGAPRYSLAELSGVTRDSADVAKIVDKLVGGAGADLLAGGAGGDWPEGATVMNWPGGAATEGEANPPFYRSQEDLEKRYARWLSDLSYGADDNRPGVTTSEVVEAAKAAGDPDRNIFSLTPDRGGFPVAAPPPATGRAGGDQGAGGGFDDWFGGSGDAPGLGDTPDGGAYNPLGLGLYERDDYRSLTLDEVAGSPESGMRPPTGASPSLTVMDFMPYVQEGYDHSTTPQKRIDKKLNDGSRLSHNVNATIAFRERWGLDALKPEEISLALFGVQPDRRVRAGTDRPWEQNFVDNPFKSEAERQAWERTAKALEAATRATQDNAFQDLDIFGVGAKLEAAFFNDYGLRPDFATELAMAEADDRAEKRKAAIAERGILDTFADLFGLGPAPVSWEAAAAQATADNEYQNLPGASPGGGGVPVAAPPPANGRAAQGARDNAVDAFDRAWDQYGDDGGGDGGAGETSSGTDGAAGDEGAGGGFDDWGGGPGGVGW